MTPKKLKKVLKKIGKITFRILLLRSISKEYLEIEKL
jgi:hypothetical protein